MKDLPKKIDEALGIKLGVNKSNELSRLIYEIYRRDGYSVDEVLANLKKDISDSDITKGELFSYSKEYLIRKRFPKTSSRLKEFKPYLNKLDVGTKTPCNIKTGKDIENVFITKDAQGCKFSEDFLKRIPSDVKIKVISSLKEYRKIHEFDSCDLRKRDIFLTKEKCDFFKPCPCTKFHVGCGYYIVNTVFGCPMDCSYCYLQQYTNFPGVTINVNLEDYFLQFNRLQEKRSGRILRLGTGEFSDSLAFDEYTNYSVKLIDFFKDKNVLFELKTKTNNISLLPGLEHNKKIVISWSLNPDSIIKSQELFTASLDERLDAAGICQEAGYRIAFHFDPIIYYDNWYRDYKGVVDRLFSTLNPDISWISLGTLRFNPELKSIIESRFPGSDIVYAEMVIAEDGKLRYPEFLRKQIYRDIIKLIREYDQEVGIYLCMESSFVWEDTVMKVDSDIENFIIYQALRR